MYELILSFWLFTGDTYNAKQKEFKTLEACEVMQPIYQQAGNQLLWEDVQIQEKAKYVYAVCVKKGSSKKEILQKVIDDRFKPMDLNQ